MSQNPVPFRRITDSLYQIGADSPDNPTFLYFVTAATPNSGPVSLADSWQNPDFPGYYVLMTHAVPPGREGPLVRALRRILPDPGAGVQIAPPRQRGVTRTSNRSLVWLEDGAKSSRNWRFSLLPLVQIDPQSSARKVFSDNDFSCGLAITPPNRPVGSNICNPARVVT